MGACGLWQHSGQGQAVLTCREENLLNSWLNRRSLCLIFERLTKIYVNDLNVLNLNYQVLSLNCAFFIVISTSWFQDGEQKLHIVPSVLPILTIFVVFYRIIAPPCPDPWSHDHQSLRWVTKASQLLHSSPSPTLLCTLMWADTCTPAVWPL